MADAACLCVRVLSQVGKHGGYWSDRATYETPDIVLHGPKHDVELTDSRQPVALCDLLTVLAATYASQSSPP